jgi:uncharacterized HAD superfamily protein
MLKLPEGKIALDIDEVLADTLSSLLEYYNPLFNTEWKREEFKSYVWWKELGLSLERTVEMWYDFMLSDKGKDIPVIKGAIAGVERLGRDNELIAVTSRANDFREQTGEWLDENFSGLIRGVYFGNHYSKSGGGRKKSALLDGLGVELLVDDLISNVEDVAGNGIKTWLFDAPWNRDIYPPRGSMRVYGGEDVLDKIS